MAEDIVLEQSTQTQQPAVSAEVAEQMAISLNGGMPPAPIIDTPATPDAAAAAATTNEPTVAPFDILKEKFSYQSAEDAVKEIEELRALRANPTIEPLKFENENSEKIFRALQSGKTKEVTAILAQQERLESLTTTEVTKESAADIIKLGMQLKYKDLTPDEIDYKFNKEFAVPKEPVQADGEEDDDFIPRKMQWQEQVADIEMNKIIEAKLAKPELELAKSKLVMPEVEATIDEGYLQYKESLELQKDIDAAIIEVFKPFTPEMIETKMPFNDETNKVAFEFQFKPDTESFDKARVMATDAKNFFGQFVDQTGKLDPKRLLDAMYFATNKDKILMAAMTQAKNATIKALLPDNSNQGMNRQNVQQAAEPTELQKQMQLSLNGYTRQTA